MNIASQPYRPSARAPAHIAHKYIIQPISDHYISKTLGTKLETHESSKALNVVRPYMLCRAFGLLEGPTAILI
jgi:hypothetical protein